MSRTRSATPIFDVIMTDPPITLRTARDTTIDLLCQRFAEESLSMAELERRLEKARAARTREELIALVEDLQPKAVTVAEPAGGATAPASKRSPKPRPRARSAESGSGSAGGLVFAVMAGTVRKGKWKPPPSVAAVAIMGGVELDFRDAVLLEGTTEVNCFAFWGGIEITVPPDVNVEAHGFALMGGFDQTANTETDAPDDAPTLRINGLALMGGVEIRVKERGRR